MHSQACPNKILSSDTSRYCCCRVHILLCVPRRIKVGTHVYALCMCVCARSRMCASHHFQSSAQKRGRVCGGGRVHHVLSLPCPHPPSLPACLHACTVYGPETHTRARAHTARAHMCERARRLKVREKYFRPTTCAHFILHNNISATRRGVGATHTTWLR